MNQDTLLHALETRAKELQFAARKASGKQRMKHLANLSKVQRHIAAINSEQQGAKNG
jgi:uncharacterized membrane protein (DUF106 family)